MFHGLQLGLGAQTEAGAFKVFQHAEQQRLTGPGDGKPEEQKNRG
jgi:hypothetical protein